MAATAAALLEWQPVFVLEKENYSLREENRHLHFQVKELMQWKEKALKHMVALGPKRQRAHQDVQQAVQLQKKLQHVEKSLLVRSELHEANRVLQQKEAALLERVARLEAQNAALESQLSDAKHQVEISRAHLQRLADQFREHLEQLVEIREQIDGASSSVDTAPTAPEQGEQDAEASGAHDDVIEESSVLVAGLSTVSTKCIHWFQQRAAASFAAAQEKAALYEAQHDELTQLRERVLSVRQDVELGVAAQTQQAQQLAQTQADRTQLESELQRLRALYVSHSRGQAHASDRVRLLVTEVRQYLRLVRSEIRKKFGYVPDAIAHADGWARVLDALDSLERQLRLRAA